MLDCGQDGSCFFHCIAYALNSNEIYKDDPHVYNSQDLRNILANSITNKLFNEIIEIYRILKDNDELYDTWNPYTIKIQEFKDLIIDENNVFWGDHILIGLLMKVLDIKSPKYHWKNNKGYPTKQHRKAIAKFGSNKHHRKSFQLLPTQLTLSL